MMLSADKVKEVFSNKEALLLDMNSTFMFGEDRFGEQEDYSKYYRSIGGELPRNLVNHLIHQVFEYLGERYPAQAFRHCFPSLDTAIDICSSVKLNPHDKERIIETFSYHEHGEVPIEYVRALRELSEIFRLSLVVDIWAPKAMWVTTFKSLGIWDLFSAYSFSSDHGMVKPSPKPFEMVVKALNVSKQNCLVIGDSIKRDLGGAQAAGLDCVLVNGAISDKAIACYPSLLDFCESVRLCSQPR